MKKSFLFVLASFFFVLSHAIPALAECASDIQELNALVGHEFHTSWHETTAKDHKPMILRITEEGDKLHLVFDKTGDGVWGSGSVEVCKKGANYEIVASGMHAGRAAPMLLRGMMNGNQRFDLVVHSASSISVNRPGWGGDFASGEQ